MLVSTRCPVKMRCEGYARASANLQDDTLETHMVLPDSLAVESVAVEEVEVRDPLMMTFNRLVK